MPHHYFMPSNTPGVKMLKNNKNVLANSLETLMHYFSLIPCLTALCTLFTISDLSKRLLHPSSLFHREIERQAKAAKAEQEVGKETWCWW